MAKRAIKKKKQNEKAGLAEAAIKGIQEKKGHHIAWLDLRKIPNAVCDHFIICEATSTTQIEALARSVEEMVLKQTGQKPWHTEGKQNAQWVLIDYVSVVVHIFLADVRQFYDLESLWADAEVREVSLQD